MTSNRTEIIHMNSKLRDKKPDASQQPEEEKTAAFDLPTQTFLDGEEQSSTDHVKTDGQPIYTRHDLHLSRRAFHLILGVFAATVYNLFVTRSQAIAIVGAVLSALYLLEQIRIAYPHLAEPLTFINKFLLRAEERLKESSSIPMAVAILCTILTFPKVAGVIAIYSLGIGDPLSAIVGIKYGNHSYAGGRKTFEGSAAFFISVCIISFAVLVYEFSGFSWPILGASFFIGLFGAAFEAVPLKIDDNLTIPLFIGLIAWIVCALFGIVI